MRLSPAGRRYAYVAYGPGDPHVTVVERDPWRRQTVGPGHAPRWATSAVLRYSPHDGLGGIREAEWPAWAPRGLAMPAGNSLAVAGAHTAVHRTDPLRLIDSQRGEFLGYGEAAYADDGRQLAVLVPDWPRSGMQSVGILGAGLDLRFVYEGAAVWMRCAGTALVWSDANGAAWGLEDVADETERPTLLARPAERVTHPVPVYTRDGLFVLHLRAIDSERSRICLGDWHSMAAGDALGYVLGEAGSGYHYDHDARALTDQPSDVVAMWTTAAQPDGAVRSTLGAWEPLAPARTVPVPFGVAVRRPKALAEWFDRGRYGSYSPACTCRVIGGGMYKDGDGNRPPDWQARVVRDVRDAGAGFISADDVDWFPAEHWPLVHGVWVHEPHGLDDAAAAIDGARGEMRRRALPVRPVIVVATPPAALAVDFGIVADAVACEVYHDIPAATYEQQLDEARQRIAAVLARQSASVYLVVQSYDRSNPRWAERPDLMEALQQAANEALTSDRVLGLWWFAYARSGGVLTYPRLEAWHALQVALTPALPPRVDPVPKPKPTPMPDLKPDIRQIPRDQIVRGLEALHGYLVANGDRLGTPHGFLPPAGSFAERLDVLAAYGLSEFLGAFQAEGPLPGDAAGYDARRQRAQDHAVAVIEREWRARQPGTDPAPPPPGTLAGPLGLSGRDIVKP
jgi:hypothetical protein